MKTENSNYMQAGPFFFGNIDQMIEWMRVSFHEYLTAGANYSNPNHPGVAIREMYSLLKETEKQGYKLKWNQSTEKDKDLKETVSFGK